MRDCLQKSKNTITQGEDIEIANLSNRTIDRPVYKIPVSGSISNSIVGSSWVVRNGTGSAAIGP
jgi:hypothetical protein